MLFKLLFRAEPIPGESRVPQILAGKIIPEVLASIFVFARLYTRAVISQSWGIDDVFVTISWLCSLALCVVDTLTTRYGSGHHMADVPLADMEPALKLTFSTAILYLTTLACLKISICLFYLRLFVDRKSRYLIIGTITWILLFTIPCIIVWIFQCNPVRGAYDFSTHPRCINTTAIFYLSSVSNIITDVWLICFITPKILRLNLPTTQKLALLFVITLGWLSTIAAIVRVVKITLVVKQSGADMTWVAYDVSIWSGVEITGGLFCVSAPAIKPLIQYYAPGLLSSISRTLTRTLTRSDNRQLPSNNARGSRMSYMRSGHRRTNDTSAAFELHSKSDSDRHLPLPGQNRH